MITQETGEAPCMVGLSTETHTTDASNSAVRLQIADLLREWQNMNCYPSQVKKFFRRVLTAILHCGSDSWNSYGLPNLSEYFCNYLEL